MTDLVMYYSSASASPAVRGCCFESSSLMEKPAPQSTLAPKPDRPACLAGQAPAPDAQALANAIPSSKLFHTRREITISHEGALYRLRITRQGKLILHK